MAIRIEQIGDIHILRKNLFPELQVWKKRILESNIDLLVFNGDMFEKELSFNSVIVRMTIDFFYDLAMELDQKVVIVFIKGTKTHDLDMVYNIFKLCKGIRQSSTTLYFDVYGEFTHKFSDGEYYDFLFLPEEYPVDYLEYYKPVINDTKRYDAVFLHGTISKLAHLSQLIESEKNVSSHPIWDEKVLSNMGRVILCNHIHRRSNYKNIYYPSSFSSESHGEKSDKGTHLIVLSKDTYNVKHQPNHHAPIYLTVNWKTDIIDSQLYEDDDGSIDTTKVKKTLTDMMNEKTHVRIVYDKDDKSQVGYKNELDAYFTTNHINIKGCLVTGGETEAVTKEVDNLSLTDTKAEDLNKRVQSVEDLITVLNNKFNYGTEYIAERVTKG